MLILTNLYQLRFCGDYLNSVGVSFGFKPLSPFELCGFKPDIIITNLTHESLTASSSYPDIKFVGKDWKFPNYNFYVPDALLDEISTISAEENTLFPRCDISYFNDKGKENIPFINYLRSLGNAKFVGSAYCEDEVFKKYNQRMTPSVYKMSKVVGATNKEEGLKALFMDKPVICPTHAIPYAYQNVNNLDLCIHENQSRYAWSLSHTIFLSELFELLHYPEKSAKILESIKIEESK